MILDRTKVKDYKRQYMTITRLLLLVTGVFVTLSMETIASTPSFNCELASTPVEYSICDSDHLSELDRMLSGEYSNFLAALPSDKKELARSMQRIWVKNRGVGCDQEEFAECIKENYYQWINNISKNVLVVEVPLTEIEAAISYPFDRNIDLSMEVIHGEDLSEYEIDESYRLLTSEGHTIHEGNYWRSGTSWQTNRATHIVYYLSGSGMYHVALKKLYEDFGGRCMANTEYSLEFLTPSNLENSISSVTLFESKELCGLHESQLLDWSVSDTGSLLFLEPVTNNFYYQSTFVEIKATEIVSSESREREFYYVDDSLVSFLGTPYPEIIDSVVSNNRRMQLSIESASCESDVYSLSDYWQLKDVLAQYNLGFNQIEFYANNILRPDAMEAAMIYRPLLEAALMYLDKARSVSDWRSKIVSAAREYPKIQATGSYYYVGNSDWDINPFVEAGFFTDSECYSKLPSIWVHASMEEWFYLFWARRVNDGRLDRTESFMNLILGLMESYETALEG